MRMSKIIILSAMTALSTPAFADDLKYDWSPCKKEVNLWCTDAKTDDDMYNCLFKHDSALSKACDEKAVSPYEKKAGKAG